MEEVDKDGGMQGVPVHENFRVNENFGVDETFGVEPVLATVQEEPSNNYTVSLLL